MDKLIIAIVAFAADIFAMLVAVGIWAGLGHFGHTIPAAWIVVFFFSIKTTMVIWANSGGEDDWE